MASRPRPHFISFVKFQLHLFRFVPTSKEPQRLIARSLLGGCMDRTSHHAKLQRSIDVMLRYVALIAMPLPCRWL